MAERAEPYLPFLLRDNSDKSPAELEEIAAALSPGGAHDGGLLVSLARDRVCADPLLVAATLYHNWHGGKIGFQFLPDPAEHELDEYEGQVGDLVELFELALDGDPRRILTGEDRAFFESLPDRFTVYRGCAGVSPEHAGAGLCWTMRRDVAEWFANRFSRPEVYPVLVTATFRRTDVLLAKASEYEIVTRPRRSRALKCRATSILRQPQNMTWGDSDRMGAV
jgi:hypothetical protein